ncbi:MAG TPA: hypothetical protein VFK58_04240 [Sphingomicrobium sp.]|nr:hypothetical protein [Sphingomicrobium sp.]
MTAQKPFTMLAAVIFLLMALVHVLRLVTDFQVIVGTHALPQWASIVAIAVTGLLSVMLFRESRR